MDQSQEGVLANIIACGYDVGNKDKKSENGEYFIQKINPYVNFIKIFRECTSLNNENNDSAYLMDEIDGIICNHCCSNEKENLQKRFPNIAFGCEEGLADKRIKEHFLTRIFTFADFRAVKATNSLSELVKFQTKNKFLLKAYEPSMLKKLGNIVANSENRNIEEVFKLYSQGLYEALSESVDPVNTSEVLLEMKGFFKDYLTEEEKRLFKDMLESYKNGKIPLSIPRNVLKSWAEKYDNHYLLNQTLFQPYPSPLMEGIL